MTTAEKPILEGKALLDVIIESIDSDKAEDIVTIDLGNKTDIADYMVVASGNVNRHVAAISEHLAEKLKKLGHSPIQVEGLEEADWVLLDTGDVIVHVFRPEVRDFYKIEQMWEEMPSLLSRQVEEL
ncbi:MAG: ribosome silencing factor [Alphaproteobacteria bacterium]